MPSPLALNNAPSKCSGAGKFGAIKSIPSEPLG